MTAPTYTGTLARVPTHLGWRHWADHTLYAGWRIQEHVDRGTFRLMNARGKRVLKGTLKECRQALDKEKENGLKPRGGHFVLLIPGLNGHALFFRGVESVLHKAGYESMAVDYPSGYNDVRGHARQIAALIDRLEGVETLSFVTHSMGGLILRTLLDLDNNWFGRFQLGRIVMIAPPHHGSFFADAIYARPELRPLYEWVCGGVGYDLTSQGARDLPELKIPVGVIVGGSGKERGFNPLGEDDNDGFVSVRSSKTATVAGFLQLRNWSHTLMLFSPALFDNIIAYLRRGRFSPYRS